MLVVSWSVRPHSLSAISNHYTTSTTNSAGPSRTFPPFEMFGLYRALGRPAERLLPSASPGIQGGYEGMLFRPEVGTLVFVLLYWHQGV